MWWSDMINKQKISLYFVTFLLFLVSHSQVIEENNKSVLIIAHRGSTGEDIPENTTAAFRRSIRIGVDLIEIDLRGSLDGRIMIMHDETLDRTTNGFGKLNSFTYLELKNLDAGNEESIPTYDEVLDLIGGTRTKLLLDIKLSATLPLENIVALTETYHSTLDVVAGVRNLNDLNTIKRINPNIRTLGFISKPGLAEDFIKAGVDIIRLWPKWIKNNPDLIGQIHNLGKPVWSTCTSPSADEHQYLIDAGINGIITDYPQLLKELLIKKQN